jgi:dolichol-phosphate mannosyltransferase
VYVQGIVTGDGALIIVPTYNERDNVRAIALAVHEHVPGAHILFVDDGSPDGTGTLLDQMAQAWPWVHVMHRAGKLGLGTAYLQGFAWGLGRDYTWLVEMDADFSHDPRYLPGMLARARAQDVVIGSRYTRGGGTAQWGLGRRILSRGGGLYARAVLGLPVADLTAGFVCWHRRVLERLALDEIKTSGYGFQIELKYRAHHAGFRLDEMPIVFVDRRVGQSKMSRKIAIEALLLVIRLRLGRLA